MKPDRRRTPRINLAALAYVNFERDNGGIVLNLSEEGLCFRAAAPVQTARTLNFSLSANGICVEGVALLVWTDQHRKTGGLRFDGLAPEAQRRIRSLMVQSSRPIGVIEKDQQQPALFRKSRHLLGAAPGGAAAITDALSQWIRVPLRWGDFSRGLAVGLFAALFVAALFSLDLRRQQIGSFLIRLGEHLEAMPEHKAAPNVAGTLTSSIPRPPAAETTIRPRIASFAASPAMPASTSSAPARHIENIPPQSAVKIQPPGSSKLELRAFATAILPSPIASLPLFPAPPSFAPPSPAAINFSRPASVAAEPTSSQREPASPAYSAGAINASNIVAKAVDGSRENENAEDVVEINSGMPLGKYFDVGKFKDESAANQIERNLIGLGFRSGVLPKSLLWVRSYQVLVGPYRNMQEAEAARRSLESQGYKARSLATRSRQLTLFVPVMDAYNTFSEEKVADNFIVTWETYGAEATVRLVKQGETSRAAVGRWVKLSGPSTNSAIVHTIGQPGKRTLLSIQFQGMKQAVMLPNSGDRGIVF